MATAKSNLIFFLCKHIYKEEHRIQFYSYLDNFILPYTKYQQTNCSCYSDNNTTKSEQDFFEFYGEKDIAIIFIFAERKKTILFIATKL